jgi:hypothetical protein
MMKKTARTHWRKSNLWTSSWCYIELAHLITGVISGYRIEEIENKPTQQVRLLDKLVDELAKRSKDGKLRVVLERSQTVTFFF